MASGFSTVVFRRGGGALISTIQLLAFFPSFDLTLAVNNNGASKLQLGPVGPLPNGATLHPLDHCPLRVAEGTVCGNLTVPERRDVKNGRMITVPVAVLHAPDHNRQVDPFLFLMGGQGQGFRVLQELAQLPAVLQRDVITMEQRGTELTDSFDGCPSLPGSQGRIDYTLTAQCVAPDSHQIKMCNAEISKAGVDRDAYDTEAGADDLWDLKQLLKIDRWNIFGVSYGGRTAETFLRKHPGDARSLVLDSPQVTGIPFIFGYSRLTKIGTFLEMCAASKNCGHHFPDLKKVFEQTVHRLAQKPVPVFVWGNRQVLNARTYIRIITWILYTLPEDNVRELPAAMIAANDGDFAPLLSLETWYAKQPLSLNSPGDFPNELGFHIAQQAQMLCKEEYPYLHSLHDPVNISLPAGWSPSVQHVAAEEQRVQAYVCRQWDVEPSDRYQGSLPPRDEVPTLIVHGDHDAIAQSEDQEQLAQSYPWSTRLVFPWTGHAIIERRRACFFPMLLSFVTSPSSPLNTSCVSEVTEPEWLRHAPQASRPETYLSMMQNVAANEVKDFGFPGITVRVDLGRSNVHGSLGVGLADPSQGLQLTGKEPSRIASMTKTYTAAAILRLVERGDIHLNHRASKYLSNDTIALLRFGGYKPSEITVAQLLQHISGLPDYNDDAYKAYVAQHPQHRWSRREQIQWAFNHSKPVGAPGQRFAYSDTGYVLLGEMIEKQSNLSQAHAYKKLLQFERLGLRHTWFESLEKAPTDLPPRAHQFYGTVDATNFDPSFDLWGGGGLAATVEDASAFLRALLDGKVFDRPSTLTTMLSIPSTNEATSYAMGIERINTTIGGDGLGNTVCWGHTGFWGTSFYHCPSENITFVSDRHQAMAPKLDYDPYLLLSTALRMHWLALYPAKQIG